MSQSNPSLRCPPDYNPARLENSQWNCAAPGISVQAVLAVAANLRNNARQPQRVPLNHRASCLPPNLLRLPQRSAARVGPSRLPSQAAPSLQRSNGRRRPVYCPNLPGKRGARDNRAAGFAPWFARRFVQWFAPSPRVYRPQPYRAGATPARPAARPSPNPRRSKEGWL